MNIRAVELGTRPFILTPARRYAPQGVKRLAELLGNETFAEDGMVVLDWSNETERQPTEVAKPVIFVATMKQYKERILTVEVRLDVDELFGSDNIVAEDFTHIIRSMEDKTNASIAREKEWE